MSLLLAAVLVIGGCGGSKPQKAIAGCDVAPGNGDVSARFIAKELRDLHLVTGETGLADFNTMFDGEHLKADDTIMIGWLNQHSSDPALAIYGKQPLEWDIVIEKQFPNLDAEYRAYCTGWSFDAFARQYAAAHPHG